MKTLRNLKYLWTIARWGTKTGIVLLIFVFIFSMASSVYQWFFPYKETVEKWKVVEKPVYKTIMKVIEVPIEVIKEKEKVIKELRLPDWVKEKEILGIATIPPYDGNTQVAVSLDPQSGKTDILTKQDPRSFLSLKSHISIGVDYSLLHSAGQGDYRMFGEFEAGRIWKIKPYIRAEIDERGNYRASGGLRVEL